MVATRARCLAQPDDVDSGAALSPEQQGCDTVAWRERKGQGANALGQRPPAPYSPSYLRSLQRALTTPVEDRS